MKVSSTRLKAIHVAKKEFKKTKNNLFINNCNGVVREVIDTIDFSSFLENR